MSFNKKTIIITPIAFALIIVGAIFSVYSRQSVPKLNAATIPTAKNIPENVRAATTTPDGKPYQYVVFAFDGSRSLAAWRETLDFAKTMNASGTPLHFTYFINAIYLVPEIHKNIYHPPHNPIGTSLIGYGKDPEEIGKRITLINEAYQSGHEIGSHGVGHIPGFNWTKDDWVSELQQFNTILAAARNGTDTTVPLNVPATAIKGFRAPDLVLGTGLTQALDEIGYTYDASRTGNMGSWPTMDGKHREMSLASIPYDGKRTILSMDYNFYLLNSHAKDTLKRTDPVWKKKYDEMLAAYMNYFTTNYTSNRAPLFIGHHFSEWNDGLYWSVMQEAAKAMCAKPYVRCATYQETLDYVNQSAAEATTRRISNK